jgi:hypothetical protein
MATKVTPIQILRSEVLKKRPDPARLLSGQPAVNTNATEPGFFFSDDTGATLFKVGPCSVGVTAPNAGATGPAGALGNTRGELWLDTTSTFDSPGPKLKVWDGTNWINCMPYTYANTIVSDTKPTNGNHPDGTLWWDSGTGLMYVLYKSPAPSNAREWTQVSSNTVQ